MFKPLSIFACLLVMATLLAATAATAQQNDYFQGQWTDAGSGLGGEANGNTLSIRQSGNGLEVVGAVRNPGGSPNDCAFFLQPAGEFRFRSSINGQLWYIQHEAYGLAVYPQGTTNAGIRRFRRTSMTPLSSPSCSSGSRTTASPPPTTTTAVAPPVRAPATTPTAPPRQSVLTAAERQAIAGAQQRVWSIQWDLRRCRGLNLGPICDEFDGWLEQARQREREIVAQPSVRRPDVPNSPRYWRLNEAVAEVARCRERLGAGGGSNLSSCRVDMNAINADPNAASANATPTPPITMQWSANLAQSAAAAGARERDLRARSRRVHIGANDATDCMFVGTTLVNIEWGNEARLRMQNTCAYPVAVRWCANTQECETGVGNLWTIRPGATWPIFFSDPENRDVRIGACRIGEHAAQIPGPSGVYTNGSVNERHLGPQTGSVSGVTEWDRNICSGG